MRDSEILRQQVATSTDPAWMEREARMAEAREKTRLVWLVTERAYGKTTGWRHFLELEAALETAGIWVSQSVGDVTISRTEVEA